MYPFAVQLQTSTFRSQNYDLLYLKIGEKLNEISFSFSNQYEVA